MNTTLYNLLVYICLLFKGTPRLDKKKNDIHDKLILIGFVMLFILGILIGCAICFIIQPPSYFSTELAFLQEDNNL